MHTRSVNFENKTIEDIVTQIGHIPSSSSRMVLVYIIFIVATKRMAILD